MATRNVRLLVHQLRQVFALPKMYTFLNYLRCHDDIGWGLDYPFLSAFGQQEVSHKKYLNDWFTGKWPGSPSRGELYNDDPRLGDARLCGTTASLCGLQTALEQGDPEAVEQALRLDIMLHAYMFTLSGIPVLYSGDEIGQLNDERYHDDPLKAGDSRYLHRGDMDWARAEKRADPESVEGRLFSAIHRMEGLRRARRVFDGAADCTDINTGSDQVLGIVRTYQGEKLVALFNFSDEAQTVRLGHPERFLDLWTGRPREALEVTLPAKDFAWLVAEEQKKKPRRKKEK